MTPEIRPGLAERLRTEEAFHDRKFSTGESCPRHYRAHPTVAVFDRMMRMVGDNLTGLRVLEYGCGDGWVTAELAARGATVTTFDISPVAVELTTERLRRRNLLHRCRVERMPGEELTFEAGSFDIAVGFAILHHLELTAALAELRRVLAPKGVAYFAEPLGSNPLINLYRRATPSYRTADEAPIRLDEFAEHAAGFSRFEHRDQLLFATGALALCYLPILHHLAPHAQRLLMGLDDAVLRVAPGAGRWAWYSVLILHR